MIVVLVMVVGAFLSLVVMRGRRRNQLAGLDSGKPQFMVEPPSRRLGNRKGERL